MDHMNVIVSYSGGLDSTALLYFLRDQGHRVRALSINYGQRHSRELESAARIAALAEVEHQIVDMSPLRPLLKGSSQTDFTVAVPHGHYAEETMKLTIVPNRNMILLALAAAWAVSTKSEAVAYAAHAGDHAVYPDCRDEFALAMAEAMQLCDWHPIALLRPFMSMTKADVVKEGVRCGAPLDLTWSCYEGNHLHCGQCGTCVERKEAFQLAGVTDPTAYQ